jgi:4-amino-4-deoxy-L-arabinose transferase-like glycosyltransferase
VPEAFETYLMQIDGGVWYPAPPVGWPLVLSLGVLVGAAWLVNPLLAGLNVLLSYLLLREIYSRRTARIAVLLLAVSPWYVFMGMNFMTHMFTLTCALLASLGVAWARRTDKAIWAWLGGLALGVIALVRPLEAVAVAAFLGLWAIGFGAKRLSFFAITGLVVGAMIAGSLTLLYNQVITGDPTEFPIMAYADQFFGPNSNALGFGPDRGMGWAIDPYPGHSPRDAVINANLNIASINVEMLGWSIGSLLVAGVMVFSGNLRRSDYLMLGVIAAVFTPHIFYYFSGGPDFGARYWFLMIIPAVALTARGIQFLEGKFPTSAGSFSNGSAWVTVAVVSLSVLTLVNYFPWRSLDKYHDFRGMSPDVRILAKEHDFGRSLVLVRGDRHPDYASASIYNPLDLQADAPVYVWDRNPEVRAQVLEVYADRPVWILEGPSITQAGYQIVRGPLSVGELLAIPGEAP